jgi:hypothetical protein
MNRRDALGAVGLTALGFAGVARADHEKQGDGKLPPERLHAFLCAYHIIKKEPDKVIEAYHYCAPVRDGVHQCIIYDHDRPGARILGVEYIISDDIYRKLKDEEKKYYHPHSYEVTAGLLIAPTMPDEDEKRLMEGLVTTWGKTWHTWPDPTSDLPMGEPILMWAATKDGQISEKTLMGRDKKFKVDTGDLRKKRSYIGPVPQIDAPKSIDDIGRQWTNEGPDVKK